jgi:hypothetical protein
MTGIGPVMARVVMSMRIVPHLIGVRAVKRDACCRSANECSIAAAVNQQTLGRKGARPPMGWKNPQTPKRLSPRG